MTNEKTIWPKYPKISSFFYWNNLWFTKEVDQYTPRARKSIWYCWNVPELSLLLLDCGVVWWWLESKKWEGFGWILFECKGLYRSLGGIFSKVSAVRSPDAGESSRFLHLSSDGRNITHFLISWIVVSKKPIEYRKYMPTLNYISFNYDFWYCYCVSVVLLVHNVEQYVTTLTAQTDFLIAQP